jgi:hypothetical protein
MQNGRYIHLLTGVQLTPPGDLAIAMESKSSDGGEIVVMGRLGIHASVWSNAETQALGEQAAAVRRDLEIKPSQRPEGGKVRPEGWKVRPEGWKVRPEGIRTGGFGNSQWLTAVADFSVDGKPLVEMVTWFRTTRVHAFFSGMVAPADAAKYEDRFRELYSTAVIP